MIGPNIPEQLLKKNNAEIDISLSDEEDDIGPQMPAPQQDIGPQTPTRDNIGPQIPAHLLEKKNSDEINISDAEEQDIGPQMPTRQKDIVPQITTHDNIGPQIPAHLMKEKSANIGPQIPAHLLEKNNSDEINISDDEEQDIGPQIPTHIGPQIPTKDNIGPQIPAHLLEKKNSEEINISDDDIGPQQEQEETPDDFAPALPPDLLEQRQQRPPLPQAAGRRRRPAGPSFPVGGMREEVDDDVIGPSLPTNYNPEMDTKNSAIQAIEERARQTKEAMENKKNNKGKVERPEWMLAPPEVDYLKQATSSNRSRQFTNKAVSKEDLANSGWTDTPAERERKLREGNSSKRTADDAERVYYSAKEAEQKRNVDAYNRQTRPMSLLEMHQQNKKKQKKSEDVTKRPFDREKDLLGTRPMDKKQKKELLRQSNELSKGFGYGRNSFL